MLRLHDVDLDDVVLARNDTHPESTWWFDPATGRCLYFGPDDDSDRPTLRANDALRLVEVAPQPASDGDDFCDLVASTDEDAAAGLYEILHGRRGWRRFRDAVRRFGLADEWQAFTLERERARAAAWLVERRLVRGD